MVDKIKLSSYRNLKTITLKIGNHEYIVTLVGNTVSNAYLEKFIGNENGVDYYERVVDRKEIEELIQMNLSDLANYVDRFMEQ